MNTPHTRASSWASITAVGLLAAQLVVLASTTTHYLVVVVTALVLMTALAAFKLCRDNCVESRLVLVSVATASALGIVLDSTIGLPGDSPHVLDVPSAALLVGALLAVLTIWIEARARHTVPLTRSPYAL